MVIRKRQGGYIFSIFNYIFLVCAGLITFIPFLNVFAKSLSSEAAVISGEVSIFPVEPQIGTYKYVMVNFQFLNSMKVSVFITVAGTIFCMMMTVIATYPLSKPHLKGRKVILMLFVFTMLFNGGIVPNFLLIKKLGLMNQLGALILPNLINVFNMLIIKNYFEEIPESVEEASKIDGASNIRILFSIIIPMSTPVLATIALFYAVNFWNSFFDSMIYINVPNKKPLQQYLVEMISRSQKPLTDVNVDAAMNRSPDSVKAATIMASTIPILFVYPFLQKYFVKGIIIGSVKG